jgi:hypothetical protein
MDVKLKKQRAAVRKLTLYPTVRQAATVTTPTGAAARERLVGADEREGAHRGYMRVPPTSTHDPVGGLAKRAVRRQTRGSPAQVTLRGHWNKPRLPSSVTLCVGAKTLAVRG